MKAIFVMFAITAFAACATNAPHSTPHKAPRAEVTTAELVRETESREAQERADTGKKKYWWLNWLAEGTADWSKTQ